MIHFLQQPLQVLLLLRGPHVGYHLIFSSFFLNWIAFPLLNIKQSRKWGWTAGSLNLPFKSFASLRGLCLKSGAIHISTAGDAAVAHYQHPSSSDMLWRLASCAAAPTSAACISPSPSQGQRRGAEQHSRVWKGMNAAWNGVDQKPTLLTCLFEHTQQAE